MNSTSGNIQLGELTLSFDVSPISNIHNFRADGLSLAEHNYPVAALERTYRQLKDLPLPLVEHIQPLLLIGSHMSHLITPIQPIQQGPQGGPAAVCTHVGWSLQGPMIPMQNTRRGQHHNSMNKHRATPLCNAYGKLMYCHTMKGPR